MQSLLVHPQANDPSQMVKVVHFMRHGEGEHNAACDSRGSKAFYHSEEFADAPLTKAGEQQAKDIGKALKGVPVQLVVASPLTRTLQTVGHVMQEWREEDAARQPRLVALEWCREGMTHGVQPCNRRRPVSVVRQEFPQFDFSEVADDEDMIWDPKVGESEDALDARITAFLAWLAGREEENVLVSTHSLFLHALLSRHLELEHGSCDPWFRRGELRSFMIFFDAASGEGR